MNRTTPRLLALGLWMTTAMFLISGCIQEDIAAPEGDSGAPSLPGLSTMQFDLGFLGELPTVDQASLVTGKASGELAETAGERSNWINAFVRALHVQLTVYDMLEEPVGALAVAVHSVPQRQEDGSYLWTYIFTEGALEYSVFLNGNPLEDRVAWRMEVSTNQPEFLLDHFVWFDGESMNDDSQGHWQFYEPQEGSATVGVQSARIDWFHEVGENRMRILVNGVGHEEEGDWLEFRETDTFGSIDHFDASEVQSSNIMAFREGNGSIQVPDYNDGLLACWDVEQINTECN